MFSRLVSFAVQNRFPFRSPTFLVTTDTDNQETIAQRAPSGEMTDQTPSHRLETESSRRRSGGLRHSMTASSLPRVQSRVSERIAPCMGCPHRDIDQFSLHRLISPVPPSNPPTISLLARNALHLEMAHFDRFPCEDPNPTIQRTIVRHIKKARKTARAGGESLMN